jgi:hypothetical protein
MSLFGRQVSMFRLCGTIGYSLALLLVMALASTLGLSRSVMLGVALMTVFIFFGLAMATKIVTGEEYLVYYHHEIAVLSLAALFLWLLGQPVLVYLDVVSLGLGAFLVCGRVGCLMAGCCHGRPHAWGVCYREDHEQAGVAGYLVGVRLFPIQGVESLYVALVVLVGVLLLVSGSPAGTALAWYLVAYGLGRFAFEFARGDAERPYFGGFSEAQWISLFLTASAAAAEWAGLLPFHGWHSAAAGGLVLSMVGLHLYRRQQRAVHRLLHPHHVREVALALRNSGAARAGEPIAVQETSLGVRFSAGTIAHPAGPVRQFTFSFPAGEANIKVARRVARLVLQLERLTGASQLIAGQHNAFHLVVEPSPGSEKLC